MTIAALQDTIAIMPARAGRVNRSSITFGARLLVRKPWQVRYQLFGFILGALPDRIDDLIGYGTRRLTRTRDYNTAVATRQALLALRFFRSAGFTSLDEVGAV